MADEKKRDFAIEMGDLRDHPNRHVPQSRPAPLVSRSNPVLPVISYCASSILMTVTNKYVLGGHFNLPFFLLCVQSVVCVVAIQSCKSSGIITYRDFNNDEARKCMQVYTLLSYASIGANSV